MTARALALLLVSLSAATALAAAGGLTALPAAEAPGPNLVVNGGFEAQGSQGAPADWTLKLDGDLWTLDRTARSGRVSLRLSGVERQSVTPSGEQAVALEPGFYTLEGWVKMAGLGAAAERTGARLCLDARPRFNWWQCTDIARGTRDWTLFRQPSIPVTERGTYRVTLGAYGRPDGVVWFDDVALTALRGPALEAYLVYPNFRGFLFDDRAQTVRLAMRAAAARAGAARARVSLVDAESGAVLRERNHPVTIAWSVAELDAAGLAPRALLARAELVDAAGAVVYRHPDYRIARLASKARDKLRVWVDEHNVTHLGGKPAFVLGLYNTSGYALTPSAYADGQGGWGNARIAQAPINMLINYWLGIAPVPALHAYMDDLASRGMYYLQTVNFYYRDHPQYKTIPYPAARDGEEALNRWVARHLGAHPGLAGFYTADERPADMVPRVFRQHRTLSEAHPGSVTYAVLGDGWEHQAPLWRDALDVIGLDPYPIKRRPGQNDLAMVGEWTRLGREAVLGSRPVWMVIQYFQLTPEGGWPSYEDLRTMSWMAIVDGAKGLFYWSFGARALAWVKDPKVRAERWRDLVRVTKEIKALEPVLLAPDAAIVVRESPGGAVRALGKRMPDGARYLFAYNKTNAPVTVTWSLGEPASEAVDLDTSKPAAGLDRGALTERLGPYAVKRYRIR